MIINEIKISNDFKVMIIEIRKNKVRKFIFIIVLFLFFGLILILIVVLKVGILVFLFGKCYICI